MSKNFSFNSNPVVTMRRTKFNGLSYGRTMSISLGTLAPCYVEEVLPGDTFKVDTNAVIRITSSFVKPPFANLFCDVWYFFVPNRIVYDKWEQVFGENPNGFWTNNFTPAEVPTMPLDQDHKIVKGSVADYLELPTLDVSNENRKQISVLPFRAFAKIYQDWFTNQNYIEPMAISVGDLGSLSPEGFNSNDWAANNYTGMLPKIGKYHDMFTSVLPSPQASSPVEIIPGLDTSFLPLQVSPNNSLSDLGGVMRMGLTRDFTDQYVSLMNTSQAGSTIGNNVVIAGQATSQTPPIGGFAQVSSSNLGVSNPVQDAVTVNDLRLAFQIQRIAERAARAGRRYIEYISAAFSVTSPDARMQRAEFLGTKRIPLSISQVAQTTGSDDKTLASLGGYSLTHGSSGFSKAFVEHGFIIGVMAIRQYHSYSYGIDERFTRKSQFDYYDPALAHIGEQPLPKSAIYADVGSDVPFGYLPAWTSYRYHNNSITGQMRSLAEDSLDVWHVGDEYANAPTANKEFMEETPRFLDRTLAVSSDVQDQFIVDLWHDVEAIRVMPQHSVPGLIDHY